MINDLDQQRSPNLPSSIQVIDENLPNVNKPKHPKTKVEKKGTRWKDQVQAKKETTNDGGDHKGNMNR